MSNLAIRFTIPIQRYTRTYLYSDNTSRLNNCFFSSKTNPNSCYTSMTNDSKTLLDSGTLDNVREAKRMKFTASSSEHLCPISEHALTDASKDVSGSISTRIAEGTDSRSAADAATHDSGTRKNHTKSMKRSTSVGYAMSGKGKQRDQRKAERRNRRGTRNEPTTEGEDADVPKAPRLPKRQCALLIGFCGSGYSGMQMYAILDHIL